MTWPNWFMIGFSLVFVAILGHALHTGALMAHKGPDIHRSERAPEDVLDQLRHVRAHPRRDRVRRHPLVAPDDDE